jgi:hypothetical protein
VVFLEALKLALCARRSCLGGYSGTAAVDE